MLSPNTFLSVVDPLLPAQVHSYFMQCFPAGDSPGPLIEVTSQSYVYALALFFAKAGGHRPACTIGNVLAATRYGQPEKVLKLMETEPACAGWTLQLQELLGHGCRWQVQAALQFIELLLAHVPPTETATRQVHSYLRAYAA